MVPTEVKLWFWSSLEYFWPDPWDTLSKAALFFEKIHKVFKNKAQRCSTPLSCALFVSDNGGATKFGADNSPLQGEKNTYYEGGIRVIGFVNSPLLSIAVKGKEYRGLMGGADWMKTIVTGIAKEPVLTDVDSINLWPAIRY